MIHGTFMTRASWRLRTGMGRELVLYVDAMKKGEALMRIGSADDPTALESFKLDGWATKVVDDIRVETRSLSISVESPAWTVNVTSKPIYGLIQPTVNDTHVHGRYEHTRAHTSTPAHQHTRTHAHTHTHTRTHQHTRTHTHTPAHTRTHQHTPEHTRTHQNTRAHHRARTACLRARTCQRA